MSYLPNVGLQARPIDREFAYKNVAGLRPDHLNHIVTEAVNQRHIQPKLLEAKN